jgi:hypothetical protein
VKVRSHARHDQIRVAFALHGHAPEEYDMISGRKRLIALFVERLCHQWVVRDPDGNL